MGLRIRTGHVVAVVGALAAGTVVAILALGGFEGVQLMASEMFCDGETKLSVLRRDAMAGVVPPGAEIERTDEYPGCEASDDGVAALGVWFTHGDEAEDVFSFYDEQATLLGWGGDGRVTGRETYACYTKEMGEGFLAAFEVHPPNPDEGSSEYYAAVAGPYAGLRRC
ncbi:MAG TPA: hypothetical protein VGW38_08805 [Chloroflexota bacterium]|nr:hypothetical protein [Chloroflexota bacterium]